MRRSFAPLVLLVLLLMKLKSGTAMSESLQMYFLNVPLRVLVESKRFFVTTRGPLKMRAAGAARFFDDSKTSMTTEPRSIDITRI